MVNEKAVHPATATNKTPNSILPELEQFGRAYTRIPWAIFPVKYRQKVPDCPNGFKDGMTDWEQLTRLCGMRLSKDPLYGWGLTTGEKSGVWVLDVDVGHGGDRSLHQLMDQYEPLPFTVQSRTQSGGQHIFFKWDPSHPLTSRVNVLPGVDIRAGGGYVVLPPSIGPEGCYEWINPPIRNEVASAPEWLYDLLGTDNLKGHKDLSHLSNGVRAGERNVSMTQVLGTLLGRGVDVQLVWTLADAYNTCYIEPPLSDHEFQTIFESIASRELSKRERRLRGRVL